MDILKELSDSLRKGDDSNVARHTRAAIDGNLGAIAILNDGLLAGMAVVGRQFKAHQIFLPDVLLAAKAMYAGLDILKPLLISEGVPTRGKIVIGTVQGDMHDIGKNLVGIMLKGAGFEIIDLGNNVAPETFVQMAQREKAAVIGLSALLTTTMPVMKKVVELARERGLLPSTRIIVGGAPLSADYAAAIGADAYCYDAVKTVDCVKGFLGLE